MKSSTYYFQARKKILADFQRRRLCFIYFSLHIHTFRFTVQLCLDWRILFQVLHLFVFGLEVEREWSPQPATLLKKGLWHRSFPVNFAKISKNIIFTEHLWETASEATVHWRSAKCSYKFYNFSKKMPVPESLL